MLRDLTRNAIKKYLNDKEGYEKFFLDSYKLNSGVYIKLKIENEKLIITDKLEIKFKKEKDEDSNAIANEVELENFFKARDKKSFIQDAQKTIDVPMKKIFSTNVFSLSLKLERLKEIDLDYFFKNYYDRLLVYQKFNDLLKPFKNDEIKLKKNQKLYELKKHFESDERKSFFSYLKNLYLNSFNELREYIFSEYDEKYDKTYFKFYIEGFEKEYDLESDLYFYSNGFVKNKYNILNDDDILVGIHAHDLTVNDKKPFMLNQTKYNQNVPETIPYYYLKVYKDVYQYVIQKSRERDKDGKNMDIDFNFDDDGKYKDVKDASYQIYTAKGLADVEIISFKKPFKTFILNNYLNVQIKDGELYNTRKHKDEFKKLFLKIYLHPNLDEYIPLKRLENDNLKHYNFSNLTKNVFLSNKDILHNFFYYGHIHVIKKQIEKIARGFIEGLLITNLKDEKYFRFNMVHGINMYVNLLKYFEDRKGDEMAMNINLINKKLNNLDENYRVESIEEFCYVSGMVGYYLASQTEAEKRTFQLLEGVYNASNIKTIKNRLSILFDKYKYKISLHYKEFKWLLGAILEYESDLRNIKDYKMYIYAGSLSDNILYKKKGDDLNE